MKQFTIEVYNQFIEAFSILDEQEILKNNKQGADNVFVKLHLSNLDEMWYSDCQCKISEIPKIMDEWFKDLKCIRKDGTASKKMTSITFIQATLCFERQKEYLYSSEFAIVSNKGVEINENYQNADIKQTLIDILLNKSQKKA